MIMQRLGILAVLVSLAATTSASETTASADTYNAVAYFTSGLDDGRPVDRIETATLDQDMIVLYVDWEMRLRAYRIDVQILDPNGEVVGKLKNTVGPGNGRYYTYYFYRPTPGDTPGDWTYRVYVDGRDAFEARIPVLEAEPSPDGLAAGLR